MNKKTSQNHALVWKSNQRDKHQSSPSRKILGTILTKDKGGTQVNGLKEKKADNNAQGFTSER